MTTASFDYVVPLPRLHPRQRDLRATLREKRFVVVRCGRRFGKTTFCLRVIALAALDGWPVGYATPDYKLLREFYADLLRALGGTIKSSSQNDGRIELITGGRIDFWTLNDPNVGRSRKYKLFVADECALMPERSLWTTWNLAIRPTLADLRGKALFPSTPNGYNGFYDLHQYALTQPDWATFHARTRDNPRLSSEEIAALYRDLPEMMAAQELDAEFVELTADRFLPSMTLWDALTTSHQLDPRRPSVLGLDAAVSGDTFAIVAVQRRDDAYVTVPILMASPDGGDLDYAAIEAHVRRFLDQYAVVQIAYDPYQSHYLAQRLSDTVWCEPFNQGADRLEADKALLDAIINRQLFHDGDERLRAHLDNADRQIDRETRRLRIVKRRPHLKIDGAVALSMAHARATALNLY